VADARAAAMAAIPLGHAVDPWKRLEARDRPDPYGEPGWLADWPDHWLDGENTRRVVSINGTHLTYGDSDPSEPMLPADWDGPLPPILTCIKCPAPLVPGNRAYCVIHKAELDAIEFTPPASMAGGSE